MKMRNQPPAMDGKSMGSTTSFIRRDHPAPDTAAASYSTDPIWENPDTMVLIPIIIYFVMYATTRMISVL